MEAGEVTAEEGEEDSLEEETEVRFFFSLANDGTGRALGGSGAVCMDGRGIWEF